jgi:4-hydroxybenzoate polyprenyltransferase
MFASVRYLLEMIRFSHTLFALPFALLAAAMAWGTPLKSGEKITFQPLQLLGILICMVGARSAAMAFNRLVDHRFDAANPRTATRHIPAGTLSTAQVAWFTLISSLLFIGGTLCFLPQNPLPIILSLPVLLFLLGYSYTKRFTSLAHYWLGFALALAPISVWIALRGEALWQHPADAMPAFILGAAVWTWVAGFDMIYACQDAEFDAQAGLQSIPARWGISGALRWAAVNHGATICCLVLLPLVCPQVPLGWCYKIAVLLVAGLLAYEHTLVKPNDLTRVNAAFFHVNVVISMGLLFAGIVDLWLLH